MAFYEDNVDLIQENGQISKTAIAKNLNIGLAKVNDTTAGLGHKEVCAQWLQHKLTPDMKQQD